MAGKKNYAHKEIEQGKNISKEIDALVNASYKNVRFKKERSQATNIDRSHHIGNTNRETIKISLFNGKDKFLLKIIATPTATYIKSKSNNDKDYIKHDFEVDSMLHGVLVAEELQNRFNKRWIKESKKYFIIHVEDFERSLTNQEIFEILVEERISES